MFLQRPSTWLILVPNRAPSLGREYFVWCPGIRPAKGLNITGALVDTRTGIQLRGGGLVSKGHAHLGTFGGWGWLCFSIRIPLPPKFHISLPPGGLGGFHRKRVASKGLFSFVVHTTAPRKGGRGQCEVQIACREVQRKEVAVGKGVLVARLGLANNNNDDAGAQALANAIGKKESAAMVYCWEGS